MTKSSFALQVFRTGNAINISPQTSFGLCLAGGGDDDGWSDGWKFLLNKANGGDVLIIRTDGDRGGYEDWIYNDTSKLGFPKVNSVQTIVIENAKDANLKIVETKIKNSELIFFAGGDQSLYINWFKGSKLLSAVDYMMKLKKVPVAGTSAGMALLGGIDYRAFYDSPREKDANVSSEDVLKDPTGIFVDLNREVLIPPFLEKVITETHFTERDRQGRILGFMARAVFNNYGDVNALNVKGIAADAETAYCYNENGDGKVFGNGSVFFLKGNKPIEKIEQGSPLIWQQNKEAVIVYEIKGKDSELAYFNVAKWLGLGGTSQYWWVDGK